MLKIRFTSQMKKDLKLVKKQSNSGYDENEFKEVINKLIHREPLEEKYKDHPLKGKFEGAREFHLGFDLVVVYEINEDYLELLMMRIGSHDTIF